MMWNDRYAEPGFAYGTEPNDFLAAHAERYLPAQGEVLCLAEGEGRNAVFLARRGFRVTAVDSSAVGLQKANALASQFGVSIDTVVADLRDFDLGSARWDGIVSIWCHTDPALRASLHGAVAAALKPGGSFLLEAYTPRQLDYKTGGPSAAELMMTLDELREELVGLEWLIAEETSRDVREGKYHQGTSAVVQVVARRAVSR
jgi:SAM-dependent methyltransferase